MTQNLFSLEGKTVAVIGAGRESARRARLAPPSRARMCGAASTSIAGQANATTKMIKKAGG